MINTEKSVLWQEIFEQPQAVKKCIETNREIFAQIGKEVRERGLRHVVFVGRGSSDHANLVARYVFENHCRMTASIAAPCVVTAYKSDIDYSDCLMIAVSQSGGGRDIYEVMKKCDADGGLCVSVTNVPGSLMTEAGKYKINNACGPEKSITAAKSYMTQLVVNLGIAAYISESSELLSILDELPEILQKSLALETQVRDVVRWYRNTAKLMVFGRGYLGALAAETELKIQETSYLDARSYGGADYIHGPIATAERFVPGIYFMADKATNYSVQALLERLQKEYQVWSTVVTNDPKLAEMGDTCVMIPAEYDGLRAVFPCAVFSQMFACLCSLSRGYNPDAPVGVSKTTVTV